MATAGIDSAKISNEIEALVFDRLQVVSYKWLSRNFLVSANSAKRLLQEFVEHRKDGLEVIYAISGWSKVEPGCYSVRLIPKANLEEVKEEFKDNFSVHIYSVQSCLPKDPAELWGAEFVQAEELFNQLSSANNCLWDNRFSAVLYPLVKRNLNGKNTRIVPPVSQPRLASESVSVVVNGMPKQNVSAPQVQVPSTSDKSGVTVPKVAPQSSVSAADAKEALLGKSINAPTAATNKKKGQNGKASEGALLSLWGRASSKPKPSSPPTAGNHGSAEAQIKDWEAAGNASNEDEEDFFQLRRMQSTNGSGKKRRVVFDMSDDENEDVIGSKPAASLASPELPMQTSGAKDECKTLENKDAGQENKDVKMQGNVKTKAASACKSTVSSKSRKRIQSGKTHDQMKGKVDNSADDNTNTRSGLEEKKNSPDNAAANETKTCLTEPIPSNNACISKTGVKKRKILKTHIDDRGREVTEVTWEVDGVEPEMAKDVSDQVKKSSVLGNADNKPKVAGKGPSADHSHLANPTTKPNSKHTQKGAGKDTRQGNILSFFKKS